MCKRQQELRLGSRGCFISLIVGWQTSNQRLQVSQVESHIFCCFATGGHEWQSCCCTMAGATSFCCFGGREWQSCCCTMAGATSQTTGFLADFASCLLLLALPFLIQVHQHRWLTGMKYRFNWIGNTNRACSTNARIPAHQIAKATLCKQSSCPLLKNTALLINADRKSAQKTTPAPT